LYYSMGVEENPSVETEFSDHIEDDSSGCDTSCYLVLMMIQLHDHNDHAVGAQTYPQSVHIVHSHDRAGHERNNWDCPLLAWSPHDLAVVVEAASFELAVVEVVVGGHWNAVPEPRWGVRRIYS
jgi:hypothetical protein